MCGDVRLKQALGVSTLWALSHASSTQLHGLSARCVVLVFCTDAYTNAYLTLLESKSHQISQAPSNVMILYVI